LAQTLIKFMNTLSITTLLTACLILNSCAAGPFTQAAKKNAQVVCGGFKAVYAKHASLEDSIIISGTVYDCTDKRFKVPYTMLKLVDNNDERVDTAITNAEGEYRIKAISGTYRIMAMRFSLGEGQTGMLDFNPKDSVRLDLFLNKSPRLKD
jgi:hypothetical protein